MPKHFNKTWIFLMLSCILTVACNKESKETTQKEADSNGDYVSPPPAKPFQIVPAQDENPTQD